MIHITDLGGRIGPFWWVNASTASQEMRNATYNGSVHRVWRPGFCGWGTSTGSRLLWLIIR
jgi:hypothetical protein